MSRRADRTLALEEELRRQEAARQERTALSQNSQRDVETDILRAKYPYVGKAAELSVQGQELGNTGQDLNNQVTQAKLPYVGESAAVQVQGQKLENTGQDLNNQATQAKLPYVAPSAAAQVEGQQLDNATSKAKLPYVGQSAAAQVAGQQLDNQGKGISNQGEMAKLPYIAPAAAAAVEGQQLSNTGKGLDNTAKGLEVDKAQTQAQTRQKLSQALDAIDSGQMDENAWKTLTRAQPLLEMASSPTFREDVGVVFQGLQQAAKANGDVEVLNKPEVIEALNKTVGPMVNQTRGRLQTEGGRYVVGDSRISYLVKHPTENKIGIVMQVKEQVPDTRRQAIEKELADPAIDPARKQTLMADLQGRSRETFMTQGRTPVDQGGQALWLGPEELQKMVLGLKGVGDLQATHPELVDKLAQVRSAVERGELPGASDKDSLDQELKIREENRKNRAEMRQMTGDERTAKKDKRDTRGDAAKEAFGIIDKQYSTVDPLTGMASFQGDSGQKAADEKLMVDRVLRRNPNMSGAQALEKARRILAKQGGGAQAAKAGVTAKPGAKTPAKDYSALW
jgi:hypothetical protein